MSQKATLGYSQQRQIMTCEIYPLENDHFSDGIEIAITKNDISYISIHQLKELELGQSDYIAYPDIISLRTVAESMVLSQIPYMWTIQIGNYTNFYGITYEMPYIIGKTPEKGIFYGLYTDTVHEYNLTHVNYHNGDNAKRVKSKYNALCKLYNKWKTEIPDLTIFTLLNAYSVYSAKTDSFHKNVSEFSKSCKKAVAQYVKRANQPITAYNNQNVIGGLKAGKSNRQNVIGGSPNTAALEFDWKITAIESVYYRPWLNQNTA